MQRVVPLLVAASFFSTCAAAQVMMPPTPMAGVGPTGYSSFEPGTCVLLDSSRIAGKLWMPFGKYPHVEVKTDDKQKLVFAPGQVAYFTVGADKFLPVSLMEKAGKNDPPKVTPVFAKVVVQGKLESVLYTYCANVGGTRFSTLLVRPRNTDTWTQVAMSGLGVSQKQLREALSPLVADQAPHAKVLAAGRITHDNLVEFIQSYNTYAAQQH